MPEIGEQWKDKIDGKVYELHTIHESGWCHGNPLKTTTKKVGGKEEEITQPDLQVKFMGHSSVIASRFDLVGKVKKD